MIPIVAVLILASDDGQSWQAGVLFAAAGVTDQIDGYLARRWHVESAFGRIADPLADRILIDVTVILLWHADRLPWAALLIPARDVLLMLATPLVVGRGYRFEVNMLGKVATWVLYASIALTMLTPPSDRLAARALLDRLRARRRLGDRLRPQGSRGDRCMRAVVMAGGEGTRLRPLTSNQPKPMVPIVGKPCMEHILELLRDHGFTDVVITRRVPAAGDPQPLRRRLELRAQHRVLGRGDAARHGRLGAPRERARSTTRRSSSPATRSATSTSPSSSTVHQREGRRGHDRARSRSRTRSTSGSSSPTRTAASSASSRSRRGARSSATRSTPGSTCSSPRC